MYLPPNTSVYGVIFFRDNKNAGLLGYVENKCINQSTIPRYTYRCVSLFVYTLTIPAENMTYDEQGLIWRCVHPDTNTYTSQNVTLYIASKLNYI